jgi:hypothetical protein
MLLPCFIFVNSGDTLYHGVKVTSVRIMCIFLVNVSMKYWCLLEPSSAFMVIMWDNLVWVHTNFEECFVALRMISVRFSLNCFELHIDDSIYWFNYVIFVESVFTSESMIPRPCFQALHIIFFQFCYMFACSGTYFRLQLLLIIITTTCISLSLNQTSTLIHLISVLGVLGIQETFYIVIAGLLERDSFDLFLPEFDKPWVIHLRETCCCSINLCTWTLNTVYRKRRVRRHPRAMEYHFAKEIPLWAQPIFYALFIWRPHVWYEIGIRTRASYSFLRSFFQPDFY